MRSRSTPTRSPFIAIFFGLALFCLVLLSGVLSSATRIDAVLGMDNVVDRIPEPVTRSGLPVRLIIPAIDVDAPIEPVGLAPDGAMDVPEGPEQVAWFAPGQRPGENGSAVITGHSGWIDGIPSVFDHLHRIQEGDTLQVVDDQGTTTSFVVREHRSYDPNADATDVFRSHDGNARLNLVTCDGPWSRLQKSYTKRLVVFTEKE